MNGRAISLVKPSFPETSVVVGADGKTLALFVIVDESGNVVKVDCSECHPMLRESAELAASMSKFRPLIKDGRALKYKGILMYTFVVDRVDWFKFGTFLESARQFDNTSLEPVAQVLSSRFADERRRLLSLDAKEGDFDSRL